MYIIIHQMTETRASYYCTSHKDKAIRYCNYLNKNHELCPRAYVAKAEMI